MKQKVYLETTIPSYLTARRSRNVVSAAHQRLTREWRDGRRHNFERYVLSIVLREAGSGDLNAAAKRLTVLEGLPILALTDEVTALAKQLVEQLPLPAKAVVDALHIAIAVVHSVDYLLSNCSPCR